MNVLRAVNFEEYGALEEMCRRLWHETYDNLIGKVQTDYMLEKFQSVQAFARQIRAENYAYFFLEKDGVRAGYCALRYEKERLFLSKLYLEKAFRGTGLCGEALGEIFAAARFLGYREVYLTVNKENARAVHAYEKYGMKREKSIKTDIGGGFFMDDYVYVAAAE